MRVLAEERSERSERGELSELSELSEQWECAENNNSAGEGSMAMVLAKRNNTTTKKTTKRLSLISEHPSPPLLPLPRPLPNTRLTAPGRWVRDPDDDELDARWQVDEEWEDEGGWEAFDEPVVKKHIRRSGGSMSSTDWEEAIWWKEESEYREAGVQAEVDGGDESDTETVKGVGLEEGVRRVMEMAVPRWRRRGLARL
ncbi:hypothetical protein EX30DRAFT_396132 [Ascodesmis nigricans]|uniref:Uncharacterized protein n=1 Tax=Ascodesmis nigricans TaxID=341454 RepID=A0A4S2MVS0_9PEZI|nr:hypothetical protein EX30DRAFT_396132 [Ascodesmis nigricans]